MSISFFDSSDKPARIMSPFVEDYVENNPEPYTPETIMSIGRTRKRTGYMVQTKPYSIFLFEGSQELQNLLEALNTWIQTNEGYLLVAQATKDYPYYKLGVDAEVKCRWILTQGKYSWLAEDGYILEPVHSINPFLPPTQKSSRGKHK